MYILSNLKAASSDVASLDKFIENNITELYELLLSSRFNELNEFRDELEAVILENNKILSQLDFAKPNNQSFIDIFLEVCERLDLSLSFGRLHAILRKNNIEMSSRMQAVSIYNGKIKTSNDLEIIFDQLFEKLLLATDEDDNHDKIIAIAINFYAKIVYDFGEYNLPAVERIRKKIADLIEHPEYSLFEHDLIKKVLDMEILDHELAFGEIKSLLDGYLTRIKSFPAVSLVEYLIEVDTDYALKLSEVLNKFEHIRQISVNSYNLLEGSKDSVFRSLGRGVKILDEEKQLFAYMNSYSNMHYEKLRFAFSHLPDTFFHNPVKIYDWGCGQGMASLAYLDYLIHEKESIQIIDKITLIEPSELALRRAALHVLKYAPGLKLKTVNKDFDSLMISDVVDHEADVKLHLFSNVLDMDQFSLSSLINLIENNISGTNYFVCVSPFINSLKTNRLNVFRDHFSKKTEFLQICSIEKRTGEWKKGWTKVVKIFKSKL